MAHEHQVPLLLSLLQAQPPGGGYHHQAQDWAREEVGGEGDLQVRLTDGLPHGVPCHAGVETLIQLGDILEMYYRSKLV